MLDNTKTYSPTPCSEYRPKILIAQANLDDLELLKSESLVYNKYDVVTASTGQEVVERVNDTCFDAVVIGLKFPDLTGATLAFLIHEFDPLIKIVFLSNYNSNILVASVQELNCVYLDKNIELKDIPKLCSKLYDISMELPCSEPSRTLKREYSSENRSRFRSYNKLIIPESLSVVNRSQRWGTQITTQQE